MPIFKILDLLNKKQTLTFILFFVISLFAMLLETLSIGLLIPFVSVIVSDGTNNDFYKYFKFLNFKNMTEKKFYFSLYIYIYYSECKNYFLTIYSF